MPTSFYVLLGIAVFLWLAGVIACVVAIRWSIAPTRVRRWIALALTLLALAVGYFAPHLWAPGGVEQLNHDYPVQEFVPGFLVFGSSNGGGELLAFDGRGRVFMIPFVPMTAEEARQFMGRVCGED